MSHGRPQAGGVSASEPCSFRNMVVRRGTAQTRPSLLQIATEVLVADPAASLGDVARAAGIGRTSLHKLYPTRHALLVALAEDGLDMLEHTYR
jgi:AcrR family transcriptional regulator